MVVGERHGCPSAFRCQRSREGRDVGVINWGHATDDRVLRHTAQRLIASARFSDFVGRQTSGDEFLIVCPHVDGKLTAVQIANRISAALRESDEEGALSR